MERLNDESEMQRKLLEQQGRSGVADTLLRQPTEPGPGGDDSGAGQSATDPHGGS